jgi:hypothetical protein
MKLPPHVLTIDFETFWSADFTLKKLSIEEYVRSPQFLVFGASIKYGNEPSRWITAKDLPAFFANVPWQDVAVIHQNAPFDALILSHHYGVAPAFYICTLAMARMMLPRQRHNLAELSRLAGLPPKGNAVNETRGLRELPPDMEHRLGVYACGDSDNTYDVFKWLMAMGFPPGELEIVDITIRMFANPVLRLDKPRARKLLAQIIRDKRSALRRLGVTREQVSSANQFVDLLLDRFGIEAEMKPGKATKDGVARWIPAVAKTDAFMKSLLEHENPDVQAVAAIRLEIKSTLEETRLYRLLAMHERGALCVYLNFAGAHTFRWSGGDKMNWQNFPRGSELRKCILAPDGWELCVADLSQIEARVLNCLAEQWDILALFESGDPYSVLASKFFGRHVDRKKNKDDKAAGHVGKVGELGLGYGMGPPKLKNTLRQGAMGGAPVIIDIETAAKWVLAYRDSHPNVVQLWGAGETAIQLLFDRAENYRWGPMVIDRGYIILPNGSKLDYTGLVREEGEWRMRDRYGKLMFNNFGQPIRLYGALMIENVVQALSRVIMAAAMPLIRATYRLVMSTHDELASLCRAGEGQQCVDYMISKMIQRPSWMPRIPLAAEGGFDVCYSK